MSKEAPPSYDSLFPPGGASSDYGSFGSSETVKSELAIFETPSYQVSQLKAQWLDVYPNNQYQGSSGANIIFKIDGSPGWYYNFLDSYLTMSFKILDDKGVDVKEQVVALENFGIATLIKDMTFATSNQTKLEGENQTYAYRAYLYALMNGSKSAKNTQLSSYGWVKDDADSFDKPYTAAAGTTAAVGNKGFGVRRDWTKVGLEHQLIGSVFLDTWIQPQYFLDNQDFHLTIKLNDPKFSLHANDDTVNYKINITECTLCLRQVQVSPSVLMGHAKGLQSQNYILPYNGHKIYTKLIKPGGLVERTMDVTAGVYPKCLIVGFVDHEAYCGKYSLSPFNFQHFDVSEIGLSVNGQPLPAKPFRPDFGKKKTGREYYHMFLALGKQGVFAD